MIATFKKRLAYAVVGIGVIGVYYLDTSALAAYLDKYSITLGSFKLTPWVFLKSLAIVSAFMWGTSLVSHQFKKRLKHVRGIRSETKEILVKMFDVFVYFIAFLVALNMLGINLSSLAVIGGALGVGIGFGLQKITSNFISGIILLFEKSIKIGDLVELDGGIYGFVRHLGSRYTLIETFDGKEVLTPNEDFITNRVTNWTYSSTVGRIEISVGVAYNSDLRLVHELMLTAAREHPACVDDPPAKCFLSEFGDSSVNFTLMLFVRDVTLGRLEPKSEIMFSIWDKLKENGVEIPFPQRDIHIKSGLSK